MRVRSGLGQGEGHSFKIMVLDSADTRKKASVGNLLVLMETVCLNLYSWQKWEWANISVLKEPGGQVTFQKHKLREKLKPRLKN